MAGTLSVAEALHRAQSAIGRGTKYKLGRGGTNPAAALPSDRNGECDCSGFVCWCLKMSRRTSDPTYTRFNGGWINTSALVHDIRNPVGFFSKLEVPVPGSLWVYGWSGGQPGHVAIVDAVKKSGTTIIHCSSGNYERTRDAIRKTAATLFEKNPRAVLGWFAGYDRAITVPAREVAGNLLAP